jgi:hypothetical protein
MEGNTVLDSLPEIGIALVGFTGIVAVFGRRAGGEWTQSEMVRFLLLLHTGTIVVFLPLVPSWLSQLKLSTASIWQFSSDFLALAHGSSFAWALTRPPLEDRSPTLRRLRPFQVPIYIIGAFVILAEVLVAFGFLKAFATFIFTGALMFVLLLAVLSFITLLFPEPE